jgi:hypothetical protein
MDGETFFANYYTVLLTLDEWASVPDVPDAGPTWQTKPKFFEFATWESDVYTLKAETEFEVDTQLLCSGLPPSKTGFKPDFAREVFIGSEELYGGLLPDDQWDSVHYMMENHFGTITPAQKIWGRVWEIQDGYIRTLKDPCTPDPTETPPSTNEIEFEVYNDWDAVLTYNTFDAYDGDFNFLGGITFGSADPYGTMTDTLTLDEGYDINDVDHFDYWAEWDDGESYGDGLAYGQETFYQYTANPYG